MKFSLNTNSLRKTHSPEQIVEIALEAGVDGMEWGLGSLENAASDAERMRKATMDSGLEILSFINAGKLWETDNIRRWSEAVAASGGKILRVAHPWYAWDYAESIHQPESFNTLMERTRSGLEKLMDLGREFGIRYVLETHSGSCFASPLAVPLLMKGLDPRCCGVIYDPANTYLEGFVRPRGAVELLGDYLAYVHVKNLMIRENGTGEVMLEKRPLDRGLVNYEEVMFALKLNGYDGWFSFEELYSPPEHAADEIRSGIEHLKNVRRKAPSSLCEPYLDFNN